MTAKTAMHSLHVELKAGEAPTELRVFPKGKIDTRKGDFLFDELSALGVMTAFRGWGVDQLSFDYDHAAVKSDARAGDGKAAGWFTPEIRDGELWATDIEWTPAAAKMLSDREYRFVSPTFHVQHVTLDDGSKARRVTELLNVALTNMPATRRMKPIVASSTEDAMPEEIKTALFALAGLTAEATPEQIVAAAKAIKAEAEKAPELTKALATLKGEFDAVKAELDGLKAEKLKTETDALLDSATREGKLTPGLRPFAEKLAASDLASLREFLAALPVVPAATAPVTPKKDEGKAELTDDEKADAEKIAHLLGVKPESK